jgi:hypothetical protein
VLGVLLACILDPKIIDNKREADWAGVVLPQAQCGFALAVTFLLEAFFE